MRIHIGQISPALAEDIQDLETRLAKFGPLKSPLELGKKPLADFYYAFVDIELEPKGYAALRSALHGMSFKQSKLSIEPARSNFTDILKERNEAKDPALNEQQLKRSKSLPYEFNTFAGRMRTVPRKDLKAMTIRVDKGDRVVRVRNKRTKLWKVNNTPLDNMVYEYVDGLWKDRNGRTVEVATNDEHVRNEEMMAEATKNVQSGFLSDSDFDAFQETYQEQEGEDWDGGIEVVSRDDSTFAVYNPVDESDTGSLDGDMEVEEEAEQPEEVEEAAPINTTEALRDVLSVSKPFTLFGGDDSADVAVPEAVSIEPAAPAFRKARAQLGLFFAHAESPFLRSQAHWTKVAGQFDAEAWQAAFWENRGEWNRQLRRRRKEAHRQQRRHR